MSRFTTLTSTVIPLPIDNVDTDQIIPARFLKTVDKAGLADGLFADWRTDPAFALNQTENEGAQILLGGANFGCGSSREHAPWALMAWGVRAVIAPSFADIFANNALRNGLLPVPVDVDLHRQLLAQRSGNPGLTLTVDLDKQRLSGPDGLDAGFSVDPFARYCLLEGIDRLGYLLRFDDAIATYEEGIPHV